ncbi:mesotocin receptor-like [Tachypleus tridentatus]|uniref:mesotocin receptor-like n=1 Tax=Tachypleus tridentatus TaxID=6853 RepID=UPI003FD3A8E6
MNIVHTTENIWLATEENEHSLSQCCENGSDVVSPLRKMMKTIRVTSLWVLVFLGVLGNGLMLGWLWTHRKRRVRIVQLFGHLAIADVLVTLSGTLPLLILEYVGPGWPAGEIFCKTFNFLLGFGSCASNYMMVPIAFDRCRAMKRPLALRLKVARLTSFGWIISFVINIPNFIIYRKMEDDELTACRNIVYDLPLVYVRVIFTGFVVFVYIVPLVAIIICNAWVFRQIKISDQMYHCNNEEFHINVIRISSLGICSSQIRHTPLQCAGIRTVKITIAIILVFVMCEAPFCVLELCRVYGDQHALHSETYTILPVIAISNSSIMPFVFVILYAKLPIRTSNN